MNVDDMINVNDIPSTLNACCVQRLHTLQIDFQVNGFAASLCLFFKTKDFAT
jgi:hypothetical protein